MSQRTKNGGLLGAVGLFLAVTAAAACTLPPITVGPTGASLACHGGCADAEKCHFADNRCIYGGVAKCEDCGQGSLCSPNYPVPTCVLGTCAPKTSFGDGTVKVVSLTVAGVAKSCDLNGDGKPDNRLASFLSQINLDAELASAIAADRITLLLEPGQADWGAGSGSVGVSLWFGSLAPQSKKCAPSSVDALCAYTVSRASYDPASLNAECGNWLQFPRTKRTGDALASTSPGPAIDMVVPVTGGGWLLQMLRARLDASATPAAVTGPGLGPRLDGRICAAIPKRDVLLAIASLPEATLAAYGGAGVVQRAIDLNLQSDLDEDGDGEADSVSFAIAFTAVPARIVGFSPPE